MSGFFDEIKENIENFKAPMKQSIENLKDDISDSIKDRAEGNAEKSGKKGCLSKFWPVIVICLIIGIISNQCSGDDSNTNSNSKGSTQSVASESGDVEYDIVTSDKESEIYLEHLRYQLEYVNENNIIAVRFPKWEKALNDFLNSVDQTEIYLKAESKGDSLSFKRTESMDDYAYFGELKDNKPNGYGVLFKRSEIAFGAMTFDEYYFNRYYMGEFKDGKFEGFGLQFYTEESTINDLLSHFSYSPESYMFYTAYLNWKNPVEYFGMFSDGERSGYGNRFAVFSVESLPENYNMEKLSYSIVETGEFSGETLNGVGKMYWGGMLYYEGELKDGLMHGEGRRYYFQSDAVEYEGEFKNDKRHGYGISYSEDGEIVYEGNWKNDDYN